MKFAIVHLTDIHATREWCSSELSLPLSSALIALRPQRVTLCISGDLAQSAQDCQYDALNSFIEELRNNLSKQDIVFGKSVFVPGNHDISYGPEEKRDRSVLQQMSERDYANSYGDEIERFKSFYSFAECFELPGKPTDAGKSIPYVSEAVGDLTFKYYLLNNAVYTTYRAEHDDNSKGTIMVPKEAIFGLKSEPDTVNILLMHFPLSYLEDESYRLLKDRMKSLSYILCGHTHDKSDVVFEQDSLPCAVSVGRALSGDKTVTPGFSILLVDVEARQVEKHDYLLFEGSYIERNQSKTTAIRLPHLSNPMIKKEEFVSFLEDQDSCEVPLSRTFVFPELRSREEDTFTKDAKVSSFDDLKRLTKKEVPIFVCGPSKSGKTSLLKYLHNSFDEIGITLFMTWKSVVSDLPIESVIQTKLCEQYADSFSFQVFSQQELSKRVALIDDAAIDDNAEKYVESLSRWFGIIILSVNESRYDLRKQIVSGLFNRQRDKRPIVLDIRPMFYKKRKELIVKCYDALSLAKNKTCSPDKKEAFFGNVQNALERFVGSDSSYPYFISMASSSFFGKNLFGGVSSKTLYTDIYYAHIIDLIQKGSQDNDYTNVALKVLPLLADHIFAKQLVSISESEAIAVIEGYLRDRRIRNIAPTAMFTKLVEAKVLCETANGIGFSSSDYLAFFAAKSCSEKLEEDFDQNRHRIDAALDSSFHDVNIRFLLFLAYFSKKRVYEYLITRAKEYEINHKSIDVLKLEFAKRNTSVEIIRPLTRKEKCYIENKRHEDESDVYDERESEYQGEADGGPKRDADNYERDLTKGIGLLRLISSLIPEFKTELDVQKQDECLVLLYKLQEIVANIDSEYLNADFDGVVQSIRGQLAQKGINISKEKMESLLIDISRARMLALFDLTMCSAHTKLTEEDLVERSLITNGTSKLIRLMSMLFDSDPSRTFERVAPEYFKDLSFSPFARNCIALMVRFYVTWRLPTGDLLTKKPFLKLFFTEEAVSETIKTSLTTSRE